MKHNCLALVQKSLIGSTWTSLWCWSSLLWVLIYELCGTMYIQYNGKPTEKKMSVIYQNINENNCQLHMFAALHINDSNCMASCCMCTCCCLLVLLIYLVYVILLFEISNSNVVELNQLTFVITLSTYQQDKMSKYKILAMCLENFPQNIINSLDVSLLSSKFDRIILFAACAQYTTYFHKSWVSVSIHLTSHLWIIFEFIFRSSWKQSRASLIHFCI